MNIPARITSIDEYGTASAINLIAVAFPKSQSKSYEMIVDLAKKAQSYGEVTLGNKMFHCAVFGRDKAQTSNAIMIVDAVKNWSQTKIFVRGRLLERHYNVVETLRCYLDSLESLDAKAYCNFVYTDLGDEISFFKSSVKGKYLVPCRKLEGFVRETVRHPVGEPAADIQAAAIRRGCFWCPNFNPKGFQKMETAMNRILD